MKSNRRCAHCGAPLTLATTGRPKQYCNGTCRKAAMRLRPVQTTINLDLTSDDPRDHLDVIGRVRRDGFTAATDDELDVLRDLSVVRAPRVWTLGDRVRANVEARWRSRASR